MRLTIISPQAARILEELLAQCAVAGVQLGEWRRPRVHKKKGDIPRLVADWGREAWSSEEEIGQRQITTPRYPLNNMAVRDPHYSIFIRIKCPDRMDPGDIDTARIPRMFARSWEGSRPSRGPFWGPGNHVI